MNIPAAIIPDAAQESNVNKGLNQEEVKKGSSALDDSASDKQKGVSTESALPSSLSFNEFKPQSAEIKDPTNNDMSIGS